MGEPKPVRAWALWAWIEFRVHRIRPVWCTGTRGWKWIACDFYGRPLSEDRP